MKKLSKILLKIIGFLAGLIFIIFMAFQLSPRPGAFILGNIFDDGGEIKNEEIYINNEEHVTMEADLPYTSDYNRSAFDLYYPKDSDEAVPVVFWVHGGGYIAGDKKGVHEFATNLVNEAQVAVVAVNYEWAPDLQYPGQVKQVEQAYKFVTDKYADHPNLDFDQIIFGGDSAGAQIAGQFVALQTNEDYANEMDAKQSIPIEKLKGFISYSGPVDLKQMVDKQTDSRLMKFFVKTVSWSLLGKKDWQDSPELQEISLVDKLTSDFPPTYITDGNDFSFQEQGLAFAERLEELEIPVDSLFFADVEDSIPHEYQFDYSTKEAQQALEETVDFVVNEMK